MRSSLAFAAALLGTGLALVVLGYGASAQAYWVADDFILLDGQARADGIVRALGLGEGTPFLRPWLAVSFWLDRALVGLDVAVFHWHGFVLHACAAALLGGLTWSLSGRRLAGVVATATFASFPLHPEAVTWISARGYPLGACWTLLATWLARRLAARGAWSRATLVFVAAMLALLSVEPAMPLAAYAPLLLWGERRRFDRGARVLLCALAAATVTYLAFRLTWLGGIGGYRQGGHSVHLDPAVGRVLSFLGQASVQLVQPAPADDAVAGRLGVAWTVGLALLLASVRFTLHGLRAAMALALCALAGLAMVASWATLGDDLAGVRYLYFPSLWLAAGVGMLAAHAWERGGPSRWTGVAAIVAMLAVQTPLLWSVNARWQASGRLAEQVVAGLRDRHRETGARHFMVHGLPVDFRGAHAVPWGIEAAAAVFVGPVRIEAVSDPVAWTLVLKTAQRATPEQRGQVSLGVFDAATGRWRWQ